MASRRYRERIKEMKDTSLRGRSVLEEEPTVEFTPEGNDYFPERNYEMPPIPEVVKRRLKEQELNIPIEDGGGFEAPPGEINPAIQQIMKHYQRESYLRNQFPDALGRGTGLIPERRPMDGDYHRMWGEGGYKGDAVSKGEGFDPDLVDFAKGIFSSVGDKVQKGRDAATTTAMNVMDWLKGLR